MPRALVSKNSTLNHFFFFFFFTCVFIFLVDIHLLVGAPIYIYSACSQDKYQPDSPFEANRDSFLSSAVGSSSQASYNSFTIGNVTDESPAEASIYGLYQCRGDLKIVDCSDCVQDAVSQVKLLCPDSYGASLQLDGCYVRYEHFDFLGKLDTSLTYKKCGKSVSNDVEFFRRRDDVLADLLLTIGFRVSSSGMVEGFGQCIGDLGATECSACLAEAVKQSKTLCGSVAAADVYLAQCYARYWASGYYGYSSSIRDDKQEKKVAIIVGTLVGILILVVILALCRKFVG